MNRKVFRVAICAFFIACLSLVSYGRVIRDKRIEPVEVLDEKDIDFLSETAVWQPLGNKLLSDWRHDKDIVKGKRALRIHTRVDITDGADRAKSPLSLNGLAFKPEKPMDWPETGAISFDLKMTVKGSTQELSHLEIKIKQRRNPKAVKAKSWRAYIILKPTGDWQRIQVPFENFFSGGGVRLKSGKGIVGLVFGVAEYCENQGAEYDVLLDNFKVLKTKKPGWVKRCEPRSAAAALYIGDAEEMTFLPNGTKEIPAVVGIATGRRCFITNDYKLRFTFHEMFSGKEVVETRECPGNVMPGAKLMLPVILKIDKLPPGFYLTTVDILKNGKSILKGRVGVDEFYIRKKGEREAYSIVSWYTVETFFSQHPKYGYVYLRSRASIPHTWSPIDPKTATQFLLKHARKASFGLEDYHSTIITMTYAADMFDRAGDARRKAFAEKILKRQVDFMTGKYMLNEEGGICQSGSVVRLEDVKTLPYGACDIKPRRINSQHSGQTGYWMICIARTALYFAGVGGDMKYAKSLIEPMDRATRFVMKAFGVEKDGRRIIGSFTAMSSLKVPEWRGLYTGFHNNPRKFYCESRSLGQLAFYAYARRAIVGEVPADALKMMRDTAEYYGEVVEKNDGWADPDALTLFPEANFYQGEGFFGYYLYNKFIGDAHEAGRAKKWTKLTYRFISDRSTQFKGEKLLYSWGNWGGGWLTWSFSEYFRYIGPDEKLAVFVREPERIWRHRKFRDMTHRPYYDSRIDLLQDIPATPYHHGEDEGNIDSLSYRSPKKGAIYFSWLAGPAIYEIRDMGYKIRLLDPPKK